jgi:hypothetical protein
MKIFSAALFALIGSASANRPQLTIQVREGNFAGVDGLDPVISWESSSKSGDVDLDFGVEVAARATNDIASLPGSIWGKASKTINGWGTSARAELDAQDMSTANIELEVENDEQDLTVKICGTAGQSFGVSNVEATKSFDSNGATITVNPRYDITAEDGDVVLGYKADKTEVEVVASRAAQTISIAQQVDDDNRVTPSLSSDGSITLEWEKQLADGKSVTTVLKPNESVDVEWQDEAWTANVQLPIDGTEVKGANVSIKREVTF